MKKLILTLAACAALFDGLSAQTTQNTALHVEITVQREVIRRGPYARYAQQLLGAVAPLSDKENYTILDATVLTADPATTPATERAAHNPPAENFDGIPVDKMSLSETSLEQAATEAARTLFTLRKRRFDLVTGEAGENVYGDGMNAALQEMARLEAEYTALFMGKRTVQVEKKTIAVVPEKGQNTLIVSRFTDIGGLLPESDLSGRPIVLELTPESVPVIPTTTAPSRPGRNAPEMVVVRTPATVRYRLIDDGTVLANGRLSILQFGETAEVPAASAR